jgi:hypothetical protein
MSSVVQRGVSKDTSGPLFVDVFQLATSARLFQTKFRVKSHNPASTETCHLLARYSFLSARPFKDLASMAPAAPPPKAKAAYQAELSLQPLKNCLVNLPAPLASMLVNNNMVSSGS